MLNSSAAVRPWFGAQAILPLSAYDAMLNGVEPPTQTSEFTVDRQTNDSLFVVSL
jgi:hypothetical protein